MSGFRDDLPIMEDVDLIIKLHMAGPASAAALPAAQAAQVPAFPAARRRQALAVQPMKSRQQRGKIRMIWSPASQTSGRRLAAWGNFRATCIHFWIAFNWYFLRDAPDVGERLHGMYHKLYTDSFR